MRFLLPLLLLSLLMAGCVHRDGPRMARDTLGEVPGAGEILADLHARSRALQSLELTGNVRLKLPGEAATQNFRGGTLYYEAPGQFAMSCRKPGFRLYAYVADERFLLNLPYEKTYYMGREGDRFDEVLMAVTPSRLLDEVFLLTIPGKESAKRSTVESDSDYPGGYVLSVHTRRNGPIERRIYVEKVGNWRIRAMTAYGEDGREVVTTSCTEYKEFEDVSIPSTVESVFPAPLDALIGYVATRMDYRLQGQGPLGAIALDEVEAALATAGYTKISGKRPIENEL